MLNFILDFLFPKRCVGCGKEGVWFCQRCYEGLPREDISFVRLMGPLAGLVCGFKFKGVLKEVIHAFKYDGVRELALPLAQLMIEPLGEIKLNFHSAILIPVPLSRRKEIERGFNQTKLLADELKKTMGIECLDNFLVKTKSSPSQTELSQKERKENAKGCFDIVGDKRIVRDKTILLLDDVYTTGSTLNECAKVLKRAGAKEVWGLVLARG